MRVWIALAVLAGCGTNTQGVDGDDSPGACGTSIEISPANPVVGERIRATARTPQSATISSYRWVVGAEPLLDGEGPSPVAFSTAAADQSAIDFVLDAAGAYAVNLQVMISGAACDFVHKTVTVADPSARTTFLRLRAVPPLRVAVPPIDRVIAIGETSVALGSVILDPGARVVSRVMGPSGGVPAYVRFSPNGTPDAVVEAFSDATGSLVVNLSTQPHTVLVVPSTAGLAPRQFTAWSATSPTPLVLDAGTAVHGIVRDPDNAALAGATVQLAVDGVPSTVATTDAAGAFTVQVAATQGTTTVSVAPPAAAGLPRLTATGELTLTGEVAIRYASLARRSLAGVVIRRAGQPVAHAHVVVVGLIGDAGSVVAGATASANGELRIAIEAGANGVLPAAQAPAALVTAVITVAPGDLAITGLDLTGAAPSTIDAAAMTAWTSTVRTAGGQGLPGTTIEVVPLGILALADAPALHLVAGPAGGFGAALPASGRFDLRFRDPAARAAPRVARDLTIASLNPTYELPAALMISGTLQLGNTGPLGGGSVQILCQACTGIERAKPIAEAAADDAGQFRLAVPVSGTM